MKNIIIVTFLNLICYQSYSQGLFMVGSGSASSPTPNAAAPINTVGITNNGNFTQNSSSTFNGTINANQDIKVTTNAENITATRRRFRFRCWKKS
jgi:hypothetical protein